MTTPEDAAVAALIETGRHNAESALNALARATERLEALRPNDVTTQPTPPRDESGLGELVAEAAKYAVKRRTRNGPSVDSITVAQLPDTLAPAVARLVAAARAEERERIAVAIEADAATEQDVSMRVALRSAARIARSTP